MSDEDLARLRRHAFGVAYRMLGSVEDAEDVAQEAMLRLGRVEAAPREPAAWLTTTATRLAIDQTRRAHVRRESYVGPWLPDPLVGYGAPGPAERAELADSLSQAFLVVLERLTALERAAFLLREVFDCEYAEIAGVLQRNEASCRQLVARARRHVHEARPRFDADAEQHERLLRSFLAAAEDGDLAALEAVLAEDAVLLSDGGGRVSAARRPIVGPAKIARLMAAIARRRREGGGAVAVAATVNGLPGRVFREADGRITDVLTIDVVDGRIRTVHNVRNPDKLAHVSVL
jgi:RNA polymerase sigma-70 factor (ECF subfamily)